MRTAYADVEITNLFDMENARLHRIGPEEIRSVKTRLYVDRASPLVAINEVIQDVLQLPVTYRRQNIFADRIIECPVVSGLHLQFKNRSFVGSAVVLPGESEPLLGAIPMAELDVIIHPLRQELLVNPDSPYGAMTILKGVRKEESHSR